MTTMTQDMLKQVLGHVTRFINEAQQEFGRTIAANTQQPMNAYTKAVTFEITTPQDGAREFVFSFSLSEQGSPDGNPTTGYGITTQ